MASVAKPCARRLSAMATPASVADSVLTLRQTGIIPHDQVTVDFLHKIQSDAYDNEQPGAAVKTGDAIIDAHRGRNQAWDNGDNGKEGGPNIRDAHHDAFEIIGCALAGP